MEYMEYLEYLEYLEYMEYLVYLGSLVSLGPLPPREVRRGRLAPVLLRGPGGAAHRQGAAAVPLLVQVRDTPCLPAQA